MKMKKKFLVALTAIVLAASAFYSGEVAVMQTQEFHDNFVDMRKVDKISDEGDEFVLYTEDGEAYVYTK